MCLAVVLVGTASAQITITVADVGAMLVPGRAQTSKTDTSMRTADIGVPGATSWDFSTLKAYYSATATSVRPDTTPFFSAFPGATNAERIAVAGGAVYAYLELGTDLLSAGTGVTGLFQSRTRDIPEDILYQLPMTLGTSWTSAYVESLIVILPSPLSPQITLTSYSVSNTVDAYGTLTLPGGGVYQALRLRTDKRSTSGAHAVRTIQYSILAANGASATVLAADTLQPNSGTINVSGVSWSNPGLTDVRLSDAVPGDFALRQNYPNPFNPTTMINYQLPAASDVKLVVYDMLGREVAVLVNERETPGSYEVKFDASGLSSGAYFYRLHAGDFVQTRKLLLTR
jgi:hypothetical protein